MVPYKSLAQQIENKEREINAAVIADRPGFIVNSYVRALNILEAKKRYSEDMHQSKK